MEYFISDLHFGHFNAIRFDDRPFETVAEMNEKLLENINTRLTKNDDLFILGDVAMKEDIALEYLKQMNCKKHLILGNHDSYKSIANSSLCDEIVTYKRFRVFDKRFHDEFGRDYIEVILSHYPFMNWDKQMYGAIHLFGHIHTNDCFYFDENGQRKVFPIQNMKNAYNVFCGYQDFIPMSLYELIKKYGYYPDAYRP